MKNQAKGINRIIKAFGFSVQGLKYCYQTEASFRQEIYMSLLLIPLAFILTQDSVERTLLILSVFFVLIVEVLNSAIESVVDRVGDEYHKLSGIAKDMGSAAVLLSFIALLVTWLIVLS